MIHMPPLEPNKSGWVEGYTCPNCLHLGLEFVPGILGGLWCKACKALVDVKDARIAHLEDQLNEARWASMGDDL